MSKLPNQPEDGPGFAPARSSLLGVSSFKFQVSSLAELGERTRLACWLGRPRPSRLVAWLRAGLCFFRRLAIVAILLIGLARPGAQPIDGDATPARLAKRSLLLDVHGWGERALAVGERGHILLSTDSGKNWRQTIAPTRRTLTGVFLIDDQVAWAIGHQSVILKSGDGGETWAKANAESDP